MLIYALNIVLDRKFIVFESDSLKIIPILNKLIVKFIEKVRLTLFTSFLDITVESSYCLLDIENGNIHCSIDVSVRYVGTRITI